MNYKLISIAAVVLALLGLAVYQAQRYFGNNRPNPRAKMLREITVTPKLVDYETDELRSTGDALERDLYQRVYEGLKGLEPDQRPSDAHADLIASAYARFLVLRRTATREEYLAEAKREPIPGLISEDEDLAETAWKYNSNWARHDDIPTDTVRVVPIFIRGEAVGNFAPQGNRSIRTLSNGEQFSDKTIGRYSVYQVLIDMTVPSIDAKEDFDVTVGTMLINDGPQGAWLPVAVEFIGVPRRKFAFTPSP